MGVQGVLALEDPLGGLRRRAVSEANAVEVEFEFEFEVELKFKAEFDFKERLLNLKKKFDFKEEILNLKKSSFDFSKQKKTRFSAGSFRWVT